MKLCACSRKNSLRRGSPWTPSLSLRPVATRRSQLGSNTKTGVLREDNDARTGMPIGIPMGAMCVQRFDDSRKFCNSHYLSHFAAFFIDARTKRSVVESFVFDCKSIKCYSDDRFWIQEFWVCWGHRRALSRPVKARQSVKNRLAEATNWISVDKGLGGSGVCLQNTLTR